ncbi:M67 family metallopeptidase [Pyrococcus yayanosii]|uniref:MPN domain-containing protein n=1 Tax=Pyrococcus yayanosii (strain CH1 / JCM 16557) TaxID=529709 RepID=F8AGP6_PYRYC|nr:M67 family metallopeptidase [Pyrococcus yayanosii]AEH24020.1 hypothetical protein PYCH_03250 [Pyrococcus yayanosii CH1]
MRLRIPAELLEEIVSAASESNVEVCGFLFGERRGDEWVVRKVTFVKNRLNSPTAFEMEPEDMVKALDDAEKENLEVVGIFHSHVSCPPRPSSKDVKGMTLWPVPWLIVTGHKVAAFMLEKGKPKEIELKIISRCQSSRTLP